MTPLGDWVSPPVRSIRQTPGTHTASPADRLPGAGSTMLQDVNSGRSHLIGKRRHRVDSTLPILDCRPTVMGREESLIRKARERPL